MTKYVKTIWYAVLQDLDDQDWGTGSARKREAIAMRNRMRRDGYKDAHIAVIEELRVGSRNGPVEDAVAISGIE